MDVELLKNKLLLVSAHESFVRFSNDQLMEYVDETNEFLQNHSDSLDNLELFSLYQLQFYLNLLTMNDKQAKSALDTIVNQFGADVDQSQRVRLLKSMYYEAMGDRTTAQEFLGKNANEMRLSRRLATFLRKNGDYVANLLFYLDLQPADIIAWGELAQQYHDLGHYDKAVFAYQEVLLHQPFAYPIFYRIGLNYYYQFLQLDKSKQDNKAKYVDAAELLTNARDNYLRAVEIFPGHAKAWLGINLLTKLPVNDKLAKLKLAKEYLDHNDKLRDISAAKLKQLAAADPALLQVIGSDTILKQ